MVVIIGVHTLLVQYFLNQEAITRLNS